MASAIYSLAPFLGPAVGPIGMSSYPRPSFTLPRLPTNNDATAAGYLTQYLNWRWIFWTVSIADALVQVLAFLFLPETYSPKILLVKARKLRNQTGNEKLRTEYERPDRTFWQTLGTALSRPFIMLFTQPALQVTALYRAYLYGLMYLVYVILCLVWVLVMLMVPQSCFVSDGVVGPIRSGARARKFELHLPRRRLHHRAASIGSLD